MQSNRRAGMTLIEVTAATALAVLMVAAMAGVLRSLRTQKVALANDEFQPAWQRQLVDGIRWDLMNSHDMASQLGQLKLLGFSGRDPHSREVTHHLAVIYYKIRESKGEHLLLRRETPLDAKSVVLGQSEWKNQECIAIGVTGIFITSMEDTIEPDAISQLLSEGKKEEMPDQWVPIPQQFRLVLTGENQEILVDEILVL